METSILIAKLAFVAYLASGVALLNGSFNLKKVYLEMEKSQMFMTLMGIFVLVLGTLITTYHNLWVKDWRVLITIIGWILLAEGFCYIVLPKKMVKFLKKLPQSQLGWGVFTLGMSLLFGYFAMFA